MSFRVVLAWLSNPQTDLPRWDIKNSALELQSGIATKEEAVRVLKQHHTRSFLGEPGYTYTTCGNTTPIAYAKRCRRG